MGNETETVTGLTEIIIIAHILDSTLIVIIINDNK